MKNDHNLSSILFCGNTKFLTMVDKLCKRFQIFKRSFNNFHYMCIFTYGLSCFMYPSMVYEIYFNRVIKKSKVVLNSVLHIIMKDSAVKNVVLQTYMFFFSMINAFLIKGEFAFVLFECFMIRLIS